MTSQESLKLSTSRPEPETVVLAVAGEVDMLSAPRLAAALDEIFGTLPRVVVVDLSEVEFLGSAGLAVLVSAQKQSTSSLRVVASGRDTRRIFTLTGLDEVFALHATREAALADE